MGPMAGHALGTGRAGAHRQPRVTGWDPLILDTSSTHFSDLGYLQKYRSRICLGAPLSSFADVVWWIMMSGFPKLRFTDLMGKALCGPFSANLSSTESILGASTWLLAGHFRHKSWNSSDEQIRSFVDKYAIHGTFLSASPSCLGTGVAPKSLAPHEWNTPGYLPAGKTGKHVGI